MPMLRPGSILLSIVLLAACGGTGSDSGTAGNGGDAGSTPGPLVDNTKWVPTTEGDELLGPPPEGASCELEPIDCAEYPWPEGDCVTFEADSSCIAAYVPECLDAFTVLAVYTRMPNPTMPLCNWLTLEQPSLRPIRAGDPIEIRMRHSTLTAPVPGTARMMFAIGDEVALDYEVLIPSDFKFPSETWVAPKDYPEGTRLLFHVDNHGSNEYMLIEVNLL
jgi:hypothetical protein